MLPVSILLRCENGKIRTLSHTPFNSIGMYTTTETGEERRKKAKREKGKGRGRGHSDRAELVDMSDLQE